MQTIHAQMRHAIFEAIRLHQTPLLALDVGQVARNIGEVRSALPGINVFYALKANPHPAVARELRRLGVGFEVASLPELQMLLAAGVPAQSMICPHPVKSVEFLTQLEEAGIEFLAADCREQVERIATHAPSVVSHSYATL